MLSKIEVRKEKCLSLRYATGCGNTNKVFRTPFKTNGPPHPQVISATCSEQSASTYPASGHHPGQDGDPRAPVLITLTASCATFEVRTRVADRLSGHLAFTTRRHQQPTDASYRRRPISIKLPRLPLRRTPRLAAARPMRSALVCWLGLPQQRSCACEPIAPAANCRAALR